MQLLIHHNNITTAQNYIIITSIISEISINYMDRHIAKHVIILSQQLIPFCHILLQQYAEDRIQSQRC